MTNNEIIVKIRAEIERRITISDLDNPIGLWSATALTSLLSFLSDLEKSLPAKVADDDDKVLEVEAVSYCFDNGLNITPRVAADFARHFYDLGCRRTAEKCDEIEYNRQRASGSSEIPKDLEEAAEEYAKEHSFHPCDYDVTPYDCFKAGAKWDKEQMMEEAVEKSVCLVPSAELGRLFEPSVSLSGDELKGYVLGDRVHIIIVKEDEK